MEQLVKPDIGIPGKQFVLVRRCRIDTEHVKNDYHIVAPDHRGFGSSTHPGDVQSSGTMGDLVGDLTCVLQDAGVEHAICLGCVPLHGFDLVSQS